MKAKKLIVVNLIGGPGVGKSILAADLFSALKKKNISCDVSWEYIKKKLRENI
jgi:adenylate kinase family enzyme